MAIEAFSKEDIAREQKVDMALDDIIKMSRRNLAKKQQRVSNKSRGVFHGNQNRSWKVRQYMDSRSTLRQGVLDQKRTSFRGTNFTLAPEAAPKAAVITFRRNNFPLVAGASRKSVVTMFRNKPINQNKARNWNNSRPGGGPVRRQGNASGGNALKQQKQQQQQRGHQQHQFQHPVQRKELIHNQNFRTLDSMFANMKEQRLTTFTGMNNGPTVRNQPRQPWLRGRFGNCSNW
ncbi:uncharacterized protein LOC141653659 [Silene latifolia]|uniref:uncharacterized protein LOC141653659 n=1 Tax=Silene latifolia TaxID=37657 RepID=UPI003D78491C